MDTKTFTSVSELSKQLQINKRVLLIIPGISTGNQGLNDQYRDYLDEGAKIYKYLTANNFVVDIFTLGAEHRGDGFLHKIGKEYLINNHGIPENSFAWKDENFREIGLCSVEEIQLTVEFLNEHSQDYQIITSISESQLDRYILHQKGYDINSIYYFFPDSPSYYHLQNKEQEKLLISVTKNDPRWESSAGMELRRLAHMLRDPKESECTKGQIQSAQTRIAELAMRQ